MDIQVQPPPETATLDHGGLLDLRPDYSFAAPGWEHLDWQRNKLDDYPLPATPSYQSLRSFNSHGSNASVYSATFEDDYDSMPPLHSAGSYTGGDSTFGYTPFDPASDEAYNPHHYGSSSEFALIEDHLGQPSPHFEITEAAPSSSFQFGHRRDPSPGSSPGEYDDQGRRSRASSVSSYHGGPPPDFPSPAHSYTALEGFANFTLNGDGTESHPPSPSPYLNEITISVSPNAPSPPPSSTTAPPTPLTTPAKPLGRPLIIPATPSLGGGFGLEESSEITPSEMKTAQPAASSSFLFPPQDPSLHLAQNYQRGNGADDADAGGPSIRIVPSTPISAGGASAAAYNPAYQQQTISSDASASANAPTEPARWNLPPTWQHNAHSSFGGNGNNDTSRSDSFGGASQGQTFQSPNNNSNNNNLSSWNQSGPFQSQQSSDLLGAAQQQDSGFHMGHRARSASHSGMSTRPWQDPSPYPAYGYQQPQQQQQQGFQPQGTVNPNEILPQQESHRPPLYDPRSLDSLIPMSPESHQTSFPPPPHHITRDSSPDMRLYSRPTSPLFGNDGPSLPLFPEGTNIRRWNSTGSTRTRGHRPTQSEDAGRSGSVPWDRQAFIKSITSVDGSLIPPDPRSPPPGSISHLGTSSSSGTINGEVRRGRPGSSSSSIGGASDRASPYSRPLSLSPGMKTVPLPGGSMSNGGGRVEKTNVTSIATAHASTGRRKNKAPFMCPVENCGSTFTRQFNLKGHLRSHREERPYVCGWPKCGKGFARQHDCKRHQALHLNIRPYPCEGCGKTFARMDALNRHHKTEGGIECRRLDTDGTPDMTMSNNTGSSSNSRRGGGGGDFASYLSGGNGGGSWAGGSGYVA